MAWSLPSLQNMCQWHIVAASLPMPSRPMLAPGFSHHPKSRFLVQILAFTLGSSPSSLWISRTDVVARLDMFESKNKRNKVVCLKPGLLVCER